MKSRKLILGMAILPLFLASCSGNNASSSSSSSASEEPESSESTTSGTHYRTEYFDGSYSVNQKFIHETTAGSEYYWTVPNHMTYTLKKQEAATSDIVPGESSIFLPAHTQFVLTLLTEGHYLADSHEGFYSSITFTEAPNLDNITLEGPTGTINGSDIRLSFPPGVSSSFSFTTNVDLHFSHLVVVEAYKVDL